MLSILQIAFFGSVLHRSSANNTRLDEQYSVDGGIKHAIGCLAHDSAVAEAVVQGIPQPYMI